MNSLRDACRTEIELTPTRKSHIYSLAALEKKTGARISRLPISIRVVLESLLRNSDGRMVTDTHVRDLAHWRPDAPRTTEIPFVVGRVVLNCVAGIPLLGDLTAMRGAIARQGRSPAIVEPKVRVDMALDHALMVDFHGTSDALARNMRLEIERNHERFRFVKWAMQAYRGIRLLPPGLGILHQATLEFVAPALLSRDGGEFGGHVGG